MTNKKKCSRCKQEKDRDEFHRASSAKDGLNCYCKDCNREAAREYKKRYPERVRRTQEQYRATYYERKLLTSAQYRASKNNIPFDLKEEDIVIPTHCPYLGIELTREVGGGRKDSNPALDRVVPNLGYIKGNVEVISDLANRMKSNASKENLVAFAKSILRKFNNEGISL